MTPGPFGIILMLTGGQDGPARWHPDPGISTDEYEVPAWAAIGRKN